jgi:phenylacetate-coenzyme A ligase PaaK-like adenylate-forming protein
VRVATAAEDHGLDIARTFFRCAGESLTPARVTAIRARGADARAFYFASEATGLIAAPCAHGEDADDAHVAEDKLGVIARERPLPDGGVVSALLLTALAPWARKLVVNWESGDTAVLERRACGCPLGTLGLTAHVRRIRSYEKLTSEGMSFQDAALVALVEDILPAAFGGRPNDYQIVEEETPEGTRVRLRVSPRVGAVDESAVAERAFRFLAGQGGRERAMTAVWRDAGTLEVVRVEPHVTDASKTLPLYRFR